MTLADAAIALGVGVAAGLFSGLLGVGGGLVMVPAMVLLLSETQHVAEGTSLLVIVPTATAGAVTALRHGLVERHVALWLAAGGVAGAAAGSLLAVHVIADERLLRRLFGVFVLGVAIHLAFRRRGDFAPSAPPDPPPSAS